METEDLGRQVVADAAEYASVADKSSRMSVRARILGLLDKLKLERKPLSVRALSEAELSSSASLRGGIIMHLDLASRSALTSSELLFTAATGKVLVAEHPDLEGFPVGVCLLLPSAELVAGRRALFGGKGQGWGASPIITMYALATNPAKLGAGRQLVEAARREAGNSRLIAYSPLTGLRARVIQVVDEPTTRAEVLANYDETEGEALTRQLTDLLARDTLPDFVDEPAASFLKQEARAFAASERYRVGKFHQHMGATLIGVDDGGDPTESDSMWSRSYFEYPHS